jgi:YD repeat-containing protein
LLVPGRLHAQAPSVYYVYDELNRLIAVVDQQGDAATYTYDAVGNILRIDRFDAAGLPGGASISLFTPSAGAVGATVQVFGRGSAQRSRRTRCSSTAVRPRLLPRHRTGWWRSCRRAPRPGR